MLFSDADNAYFICTISLGITFYWVLFIKKVPELILELYSYSQNKCVGFICRMLKILLQVLTFHDTVRMLCVIALVLFTLESIDCVDDWIYSVLN